MSSAYYRYAGYIRDFIYQQGWEDLRDIQEESAEAILDSRDHVLICSDTASGKTEAAFFPILTLMEKMPEQTGVRVLYISPLKALINDQFDRLSKVLKEGHVPLIPWHGDIQANVKHKALISVNSVLQMTPESLEAMLMKHPDTARRLFSGLQFIVIDEIHAFIGQERGSHLLCLLERLERQTGIRPRRIGLSATVADTAYACNFLKSTTTRSVRMAVVQGKSRRIQLRIADFDSLTQEMQLSWQGIHFLYDAVCKAKGLIFCTSRSETERIAMCLKQEADERREPDIFYVHHGSISAAERKTVETRFKNTSGPMVATATLTLELGIDIGDLDLTAQVGVVNSVESFVQRLGRSGRRSGISRMLFLTQTLKRDRFSFATIPWQMLQAAAIIELYSKERWMEPFSVKPKPYSLLIHQTFSTVYTEVEIAPNTLASLVLTLPPFLNRITPDEYREILRALLDSGHLQYLENGNIILGTQAENIVNFYTFYASFTDTTEYTVMHEGHEIGSLEQQLEPGDHFILAGKPWQVVNVEESSKVIQVIPSKTENLVSWSGGSGHVHERIVQKMKEILLSEDSYPYLDDASMNKLKAARQCVRFTEIPATALLQTAENTYVLMPWTGTRILKTITNLFQAGFKQYLDIRTCQNRRFYVEFGSGLDRRELLDRLHSLPKQITDPGLLLGSRMAPLTDKFDYLLPESMREQAFMENELDVPGALRVLRSIS